MQMDRVTVTATVMGTTRNSAGGRQLAAMEQRTPCTKMLRFSDADFDMLLAVGPLMFPSASSLLSARTKISRSCRCDPCFWSMARRASSSVCRGGCG